MARLTVKSKVSKGRRGTRGRGPGGLTAPTRPYVRKVAVVAETVGSPLGDTKALIKVWGYFPDAKLKAWLAGQVPLAWGDDVLYDSDGNAYVGTLLPAHIYKEVGGFGDIQPHVGDGSFVVLENQPMPNLVNGGMISYRTVSGAPGDVKVPALRAPAGQGQHPGGFATARKASLGVGGASPGPRQRCQWTQVLTWKDTPGRSQWLCGSWNNHSHAAGSWIRVDAVSTAFPPIGKMAGHENSARMFLNMYQGGQFIGNPAVEWAQDEGGFSVRVPQDAIPGTGLGSLRVFFKDDIGHSVMDFPLDIRVSGTVGPPRPGGLTAPSRPTHAVRRAVVARAKKASLGVGYKSSRGRGRARGIGGDESCGPGIG